MKKILLFDDLIYYRKDKSVFCKDPHILFLSQLAKKYDKAYLLGRFNNTLDSNLIEVPGVFDTIDLPYYSSHKELYGRYFTVHREVKKRLSLVLKDIDVLWLCWPHPLSLAILSMAQRINPSVKVGLSVRQNFKAVSQVRFKGFQKYFALSLNAYLHYRLTKVDLKFSLFTAGRENYTLYKEIYPNTNLVYHCPITKEYISNAYEEVGSSEDLSDNIHVLFIGRLEPEKGLFVLLAVFKELIIKHPNAKLTIVGEGQLRYELEKYIDEHNLNNYVALKGHLSYGKELFKYLIQSQFFVLPSFSEGAPKVIVEAMAFGKAIIATNVGGIPYMIERHKSGILIEPNNSTELLNALEYLFTDEKAFAKYSEEAKNRAEDFYIDKQIEIIQQKLF